jgi:hypothetical protein
MTTFARTIHAVNLEYVLGEINADGANLHVDDPSGDSLFNDHPFGTFDAGSGRRPPHHSRPGRASSKSGRVCYAPPLTIVQCRSLALAHRWFDSEAGIRISHQSLIWRSGLFGKLFCCSVAAFLIRLRQDDAERCRQTDRRRSLRLAAAFTVIPSLSEQIDRYCLNLAQSGETLHVL